MYDTIGMFLENDFFRENLISNSRETINKETGEIIVTGEKENMRIKRRGNKITVIGSLPKFYFGSNVQELTRKDTELAIEKLSDELKLPFNESRIFRLHIGANIILIEPLQNYYASLGSLPRFKKSEIANKNTLLYSTSTKSLEFYDKIKEMKRSKQLIPEKLIGRNVLRYEVHLTKRIANSLNLPEVKAKDLYEENFYRKAIIFWKELYFSIPRIRTLKFEIETLPLFNRKKLLSGLAAMQVKNIGEIVLLSMIEANKNNIKHREQYQRMKNLVRMLSNHPELTEPNEAIKDLDLKIIRLTEEHLTKTSFERW